MQCALQTAHLVQASLVTRCGSDVMVTRRHFFFSGDERLVAPHAGALHCPGNIVLWRADHLLLQHVFELLLIFCVLFCIMFILV